MTRKSFFCFAPSAQRGEFNFIFDRVRFSFSTGINTSLKKTSTNADPL